jgi:hypothetical protein
MNPKLPLGWHASLFFFAAAISPIVAQTVTPRADEPPKIAFPRDQELAKALGTRASEPAKPSESAVELSPFVVNDNLYRERDLITVAIQPWGEVAAARPAPERRWYLSNSFSF